MKRVLPFLLLTLVSCGGDNSVDGTVTSNFSFDQSELTTDDRSIGTIGVSYDSKAALEEGGHVYTVVRLPRGVKYRTGTAELDTVGRDKRLEVRETPCPRGAGTFLVFDLNSADLRQAENPAGAADARITFTVEGKESAPGGRAEVMTRSFEPLFSCNETFTGDLYVPLSVR